MVDETTLEEDLSQQIGLVTQAYSLYVDGELVGATPYEGALEELLSQLQSSTADENTISCEFAEDVEIKQEYVPTEKVMNLGYLAELLYSTKTAEVTYTVKAGDTWSEIAEDHGHDLQGTAGDEPRLRHRQDPDRRGADAVRGRALSDGDSEAAGVLRGRRHV